MDAQSRVAQQYPTVRPGKPPYRIVLEESAMRNDGTVFTDHEVHRMLRLNGVKNPEGEWFRCTVAQVKVAIIDHQRMEADRDERGSWDPIDAWSPEGGRIYSTTLNCLSMEVYYRYGRVIGVDLNRGGKEKPK